MSVMVVFFRGGGQVLGRDKHPVTPVLDNLPGSEASVPARPGPTWPGPVQPGPAKVGPVQVAQPRSAEGGCSVITTTTKASARIKRVVSCRRRRRHHQQQQLAIAQCWSA